MCQDLFEVKGRSDFWIPVKRTEDLK